MKKILSNVMFYALLALAFALTITSAVIAFNENAKMVLNHDLAVAGFVISLVALVALLIDELIDRTQLIKDEKARRMGMIISYFTGLVLVIVGFALTTHFVTHMDAGMMKLNILDADRSSLDSTWASIYDAALASIVLFAILMTVHVSLVVWYTLDKKKTK